MRILKGSIPIGRFVSGDSNSVSYGLCEQTGQPIHPTTANVRKNEKGTVKRKTMDIRLRKWTEADLDSLVKYANNQNVAKWLTNGFPHPYTFEDGKAYLSMITNDNPTKVFAIEIKI